MLALPDRLTAAQPRAPARSTASLGSQVDSYLVGLSKKAQFNGAVAIAKHGTDLFSKGYGMADRAHHVANRPATIYPMAGVSYSFSVLAIIQLLQRGRVKLGDAICKYIAGCPASWGHVTIQSLENGRAGLPGVEWGSATSLTQAFATCKATAPGLDPGTQAHFGNCGTYMRAAIIQRVTGKAWAMFLQDNVWHPAGMAHTGRLTDALKPPKRAAAYSGSGSGNDGGYSNTYAAYSTVPDVERYDRALFGGKLLGSTWLRTMMTPQAVVESPDPTDAKTMPAARNLHYGYFWRIGNLFGHRVAFSADDAGSFQVINLHFPDTGVDIVVVSNDDTNQIGRITQEVARLTLHAR
jgi:CubicO group peptidase (beta-lactamase class C family)